MWNTLAFSDFKNKVTRELESSPLELTIFGNSLIIVVTRKYLKELTLIRMMADIQGKPKSLAHEIVEQRMVIFMD